MVNLKNDQTFNNEKNILNTTLPLDMLIAILAARDARSM